MIGNELKTNPLLLDVKPCKLAVDLGAQADKKTVNLATNENPYPPSVKVTMAMINAVNDVNRYPVEQELALIDKIAQRESISSQQIMLGAGSSELIEIIMRTFLYEGCEVIAPAYSFSLYRVVAKQLGAIYSEVQPKAWKLQVDDLIAAVSNKTTLIILANPNNPTGDWLTITEVKKLLNAVPKHVAVLIDEAYYEYMFEKNYSSAVDLLLSHQNLVIVRTFSKLYGLAAMRVGYCMANYSLIKQLSCLKKPFNVSTQAILAATAVLDDQDYIDKSNKNNINGKRFICFALQTLGIHFLDSPANFITIKVGVHAQKIQQNLLRLGIATRTLFEYQMSEYLRLSVGLPHENFQLVRALQKIFND